MSEKKSEYPVAAKIALAPYIRAMQLLQEGDSVEYDNEHAAWQGVGVRNLAQLTECLAEEMLAASQGKLTVELAPESDSHSARFIVRPVNDSEVPSGYPQQFAIGRHTIERESVGNSTIYKS